MGRRGPTPKPTAIKQAQGNPGKRTLSDNEPVPPTGEIVPPEWLSPEAKRFWFSMAPICVSMKTLTTADVQTFGRYCETFARWLEVRRFIAKDLKGSAVYQTGGGYWTERPEGAELRKLNKDLVIFEREFGLTPAARTRIQIQFGAGQAATPKAPAAAASNGFREKFLGGPIPISKGA
jgi:P27 family predicted phage terminase small subunit